MQSLPTDLRPSVDGLQETRPCGALVLAVLAVSSLISPCVHGSHSVQVERALGLWKTGVKTSLDGAATNFSSDNWADKTILVDGVAKNQEKVADLMRYVQDLNAPTWQAILDGGRAVCLQ